MSTDIISVDEAISAATAQAFIDEDGRTTVHSVLIGSAMMLGADWDLSDLVTELRAAQEIAWFDDPTGHELAIKAANGWVYKFDVKRPSVIR